MSSIKSFIDFMNPYFGVSNSFAKVEITDSCIVINGDQRISYQDIRSAKYRNTYTPNNTMVPLIGSATYDLATAFGRVKIFGEHLDLSTKLDALLQKETHIEDSLLGLVIRWKRKDKHYAFVSFEDLLSYFTIEKLSLTSASKWLIVPLGLFVVLAVIVGYVLFVS